MRRLILPVAVMACLIAGTGLRAQEYAPHEGESRTIRPNPLTEMIPINRDRLMPNSVGNVGGVPLDKYLLASGKPHPIAIVVHGGGYTSGSKRGENEFALTNALLDSGFSVFTVAYHLAPAANQDLMVREIQRTVRYARGDAYRLNLDPYRVVLVGEEVGGLLAAAAALAPPSTRPYSHVTYDHESDAVQAVVAIACAGNFGKNAIRPRDDLPPEVAGHGLSRGSPPGFFARDVDVPIHPVNAVSGAPSTSRPDAPPVLIIQGNSRTDPGCTESTELYASLQKSGGAVKLLPTGPERGTDWKFKPYRKPAWQKEMAVWLKTTVATPQPNPAIATQP